MAVVHEPSSEEEETDGKWAAASPRAMWSCGMWRFNGSRYFSAPTSPCKRIEGWEHSEPSFDVWWSKWKVGFGFPSGRASHFHFQWDLNISFAEECTKACHGFARDSGFCNVRGVNLAMHTCKILSNEECTSEMCKGLATLFTTTLRRALALAWFWMWKVFACRWCLIVSLCIL